MVKDNRDELLELAGKEEHNDSDIIEYESSISFDGRHLLTRLPKKLCEALDLWEDKEDEGNEKGKQEPKKDQKIIFEITDYDKIKNCDHDWVKVTIHEYEEDKLCYKCSKCYDFKTEEK